MKPPLADVHTGMRVCARRILTENGRGYKGMREEMAKHLEEVATRYYSGDVAVIDEFMQLYCFGESARKQVVNDDTRAQQLAASQAVLNDVS